MRVIVTGSRTWTNSAVMTQAMGFLQSGDVLVHGTARGADQMAAHIAKGKGLMIEEHPADWVRYGKSAGFIRNNLMLDSGCDMVLAFWDGKSRGTAHTIKEARARGFRVDVWMPNGNFVSFKDGEMRDSTAMQMARR